LLYGILAAVQPVVILVLYLLLNKYAVWAALRWVTFIFQGVWWPTFVAWICTSMFDSAQMREIFEIAAMISLAGPFFLYWVAMAEMLVKADEF
jgi:hypothetical protein